METIAVKKCIKCNEEKPISEFYRDKKKPDGFANDCRICRKRYMDSYREEHKERMRKLEEIRREKNPEKQKQYSAKFRQMHAESEKERHRDYYLKNKDIINQKHAKYYQQNKERVNKRNAEYYEKRKDYFRKIRLENYKKNPEKYRKYWIKRRELIKNNFIETVKLNEVYLEYGCKCGICGEFVQRKEAAMDHIIPLSKGGKHERKNIQLAHRICNLKKYNKTESQYLKENI